MNCWLHTFAPLTPPQNVMVFRAAMWWKVMLLLA